MQTIKSINGRLKRVIPLEIKPFKEQAIPTIIGSVTSKEAGTVMYGYYSVDYHLPNGDYLRLLANHNKQTLQLLLMTGNPDIISKMPGERPCSLVANAIASIRGYCNRSKSYAKPLSAEQTKKFNLATQCTAQLENLLEEERSMTAMDWSKQEKLRARVIHILEGYRNQNILLGLNPVISEGQLGIILYNTIKMAQNYQFNRLHQVSRLDQMDFRSINADNHGKKPSFVWDSEIHIGQNKEAIYETIRFISEIYGLDYSQTLSNKPAGRFEKIEYYFSKLWRNGKAWIEHLGESESPEQISQTEQKPSGLKVTTIDPFYYFDGYSQEKKANFQDFLGSLNIDRPSNLRTQSRKEAFKLLSDQPDGTWVKISKQRIVVKQAGEMKVYGYFIHENHYFLRPTEQDLVTICQLAKEHLFFHQKLKLQFQAFLSRIPAFFISFALRIKGYILVDLYNDFKNYVHSNHPQPVVLKEKITETLPDFKLITESLQNHELLPNGQSIEDFIRHHLQDNHIVIARPEHNPMPVAYSNPIHRLFNVTRHAMSFFVDSSEKNPIIGTLAMAAYVYGGAAIVAPELLTSVLTKLHLNGLIYGIKPTQVFANWISHSLNSQAISAATSYWQGIVVGGNLDDFFIQAIEVLREHPAEIAIVLSLAMALGYGLSKGLPALENDLGDFPYATYVTVGTKAGAAIYDTIMYPGEDWLLGTIKWLLKHGLTLIKLFICPFIEGVFYGLNGLSSGGLKSLRLLLTTMKQTLAAITDLALGLLTIPLMEISSMLIHVPFRGVTSLVSKTLGLLAHWQPLGQALIDFALRKQNQDLLSGFSISTLYGFGALWPQHVANKALNHVINIPRFPIYIGFQLVKNLVILPVSDITFLSLRVILSALNLGSRILAYSAGQLITVLGKIWDNSAGLLLDALSISVTVCTNAIDSFAGQFRQYLLGKIQVLRRQVYHLGFADQDALRDKVNTDLDYFMSAPIRLEQLAMSSSHSLMNILLNAEPENPALGEENVFIDDSGDEDEVFLPVTETSHPNQLVSSLHS